MAQYTHPPRKARWLYCTLRCVYRTPRRMLRRCVIGYAVRAPELPPAPDAAPVFITPPHPPRGNDRNRAGRPAPARTDVFKERSVQLLTTLVAVPKAQAVGGGYDLQPVVSNRGWTMSRRPTGEARRRSCPRGSGIGIGCSEKGRADRIPTASLSAEQLGTSDLVSRIPSQANRAEESNLPGPFRCHWKISSSPASRLNQTPQTAYRFPAGISRECGRHTGRPACSRAQRTAADETALKQSVGVA